MRRLSNNHIKGIICIIASAFFFSLMSLLVRLAGDLPTMEKAFFRNAIAAIMAVILLARTPEKFYVRRESWPDLLLRSAFGTMGVIFNFWAIDHIAIADASVLNKMSPFFAIIMSKSTSGSLAKVLISYSYKVCKTITLPKCRLLAIFKILFYLLVLTFKFGVFFLVSNALTGESLFTRFANSSLR